uniref:Ig-like domain-containing protein n=1 Tax=Poecilia formosa TaxID=48698 RepID=A0A087XQ16_POEFO
LCVLSSVSQHVLGGVVEVTVGSQSVLLPCRYSGVIPEEPVVTWTNGDVGPACVHLRREQDDLRTQLERYRGRTRMAPGALDSGDFSLTLSDPQPPDQGTYTCSLSDGRGRRILRVSQLRVREPFPLQAKVLVVLLVLLLAALFASGGLFYYFRHYLLSGYTVKVDAGAESVLLPCKSRVHLPEDAKVDWRTSTNRKVHVYLQGCDRSEEQHQAYRDRTRINQDPLKTRDLSLTLQRPLDVDRDTYTCIVCSREGHILLKKDVKLRVRVQQVEVEPGVESVLLPCRTREDLDGDVRVEWRDRFNWTVHVHQNGSDQSEDQHWLYRTRTKMDANLLRTGDLSLTLSWPTDGDSNTYTCTVSKGDGDVLMQKQVKLQVTGELNLL